MLRKYRPAIVWLLIVVMTYSPAMVYAEPPTAGAAEGKAKIDVGYLTPETAAAVVVYPRHVFTAAEMEMLPVEVISAAGKKAIGIDPVEIEQLLAIAEAPESLQAGPPQAGIVVRMTKSLSDGPILAPLWQRTKDAKLDGKGYRQAMGPMDFSIFRPDDRTLIVANDDLLHRMLENHKNPTDGKMANVLGRFAEPPDALAYVLVEPLRPLIAQPLAMAPVPPPLADVKKIPDLLNSVGAKVNVTANMSISLTLRATNKEAAEQLEQIINQLIDMGRQAMLAESARQAASNDPVEQASAQYARRISDRMIQSLRPVRKGEVLTLGMGDGKNPQMAQMATIGVLIALLLPAVQAGREAARRTQSSNNMKQINLAMLNYESAHKEFPARANFDKEGKPLLSWRVHVLPYLEQNELYKQFHLDEPWDSEHNRKLIPMMPTIFRNPTGTAQPGMANYLAVCGSGLAFDGNKGRQFKDIRDGSSNTILAVEANDDAAVVWTKPDDWQYDANRPMAGLGTAHPGGFNVSFFDGSVRFMATSLDPTVLQAMLTIAGGEPVAPN